MPTGAVFPLILIIERTVDISPLMGITLIALGKRSGGW
jgi:hypothetical protein